MTIKLYNNIFQQLLKFCKTILLLFQNKEHQRYFYRIDSIDKSGADFYIILNARGKRSSCKLLLQKVVTENFIHEMHPVDSFFIGMLSISTKNNIFELIKTLYKQYKHRHNSLTTIKLDKILAFHKIWSSKEKEKIYLASLGHQISKQCQIFEIITNPALLVGLGSENAFYIGRETAQLMIGDIQ